MRMTYVGSLATRPDRDTGWIAAFRNLGIEVMPYCSDPPGQLSGILGRICRRFNFGRANKLMQKNLINLVDREMPDWVHFRLPIGFNRSTILSLRKRGIKVTQYFNDDPFSNKSPVGLHWKFRHALPLYDAHFVYRSHNVQSYLKAGAFHVEHCPPTYDPRRHFLTCPLSIRRDFLADAAFIGHWENDWRLDCLDALARSGFRVILKGGGWDYAIKNRSIRKLAPIAHAFGVDYNRIYAGVIAGLCFFSKINNDTWTERALEIVAVGGVLVCERTDEAQTYFRDRFEAFFFSSIEELIDIVKELKSNPITREEVRLAGYARLVAGKNTIDDRAQQVLNFVKSCQAAS